MKKDISLAPISDGFWNADFKIGSESIPLNLLAGIHVRGSHDGWSSPVVEGKGDQWSLKVKSTLWNSAKVNVKRNGDAIEYGIEVEGKGNIESISFFEGALAEKLPHAQATMKRIGGANPLAPRYYGEASPILHYRVYNPQPEARTGPWYNAVESTIITSAGTFGPDRYDTTFSPGIWCYVLDLGEGKGYLSLGLLAEPGTQHFHTYSYRGGVQFGLALQYDGMLAVDGKFTSPRIRIAWAESPEQALTDYVSALRSAKLVHVPSERKIPAWWKRPIFCGWGSQVAWAALIQKGEMELDGPVSTSAGGMAHQQAYEKMVSLLEKHEIPFGTIIIDMGWSKYMAIPELDPAKWPDLAGFIRKQHQKGRRVLLWLSCWSANGLPDEYCMAGDKNVKRIIDPTRAEFRKRLEENIAYLIGPEINADGFKIDFTADIPRGKGYTPAKPIWGTELLHEYMSLIYTAVKKAKSDAVLVTHCAGPYFGDVTDILRLNDLIFDEIKVNDLMTFRAKMAKIACPEWLIDCDGDPFSNLDSWREYQLFQPEIGIPSLYNMTHLSFSLNEIPEAELKPLKKVWDHYLDQIGDPISKWESVS